MVSRRIPYDYKNLKDGFTRWLVTRNNQELVGIDFSKLAQNKITRISEAGEPLETKVTHLKTVNCCEFSEGKLAF